MASFSADPMLSVTIGSSSRTDFSSPCKQIVYKKISPQIKIFIFSSLNVNALNYLFQFLMFSGMFTYWYCNVLSRENLEDKKTMASICLQLNSLSKKVAIFHVGSNYYWVVLISHKSPLLKSPKVTIFVHKFSYIMCSTDI